LRPTSASGQYWVCCLLWLRWPVTMGT
jgi:hypothetical protein